MGSFLVDVKWNVEWNRDKLCSSDNVDVPKINNTTNGNKY